MNIGKGIKFVRVAADLKQGQLARSLGISQNYLSLLENNKAEPSLDLLRRLAAELGVPASFLLWEDAMPEEGQSPEVTEHYGRIRSLIHDLQVRRVAQRHDLAP